MAVINGKCDPRFQEVRSLLEQAVASGDELGASITVNLDGEEVVDIWGGFVDKERTKPWNEDTIVNVWSSTKCLTSLIVLRLVDQGLLDVDAKVSKYWPEFAANGKQDILVRHILAHTSGLPGWETPLTAEEMCDLDLASAMLAAQAPWWEPGTVSGYHTISFGHILGTLVRRATGGKTLAQIAAGELAGPLRADFQIGAAEADWPRVSPIYAPEAPTGAAAAPEPGSVRARTFGNPPLHASGDFANGEVWRRAELGACNGHANARGMNRIMSAIALGGTTRGLRVLGPETIEVIFKEQAKGVDLVMNELLRFGIGFGLRGEEGDAESTLDKFVPPGKICFWGGWGGSLVIMDLTRKLTITYAMNKMHNTAIGNVNSIKYVKAVYKAFEV
ncbi:beta-lactamase [Hypoxylon argillaceum]|nr:beta-lactamase [Hypoxylon argillaceum]